MAELQNQLQNLKAQAVYTKSYYISFLSSLWDIKGRFFPFSTLEECISVPSLPLSHTRDLPSLVGNTLIF